MIVVMVVMKLQVPGQSLMPVFIMCSGCIRKSESVLCQPRGFSRSAMCRCVSCHSGDAVSIKFICWFYLIC